LICGGFTGGGSHNAAWAMSSGYWAGQGAAEFARQLGVTNQRQAFRCGNIALRAGGVRPLHAEQLARNVQGEVFPYELNYFREARRLGESLGRLDTFWSEASNAAASDEPDLLRAREAAAMLATARWMYRSALARQESRGMHRRDDYPEQSERYRHYVTTGGLDEVWTSARQLASAQYSEAAE